MKLFIHVPKNGGTSVKAALGEGVIFPGPGRFPLWYENGVKRAMHSIGHAPCLSHCRWRDLATDEKKGFRAVSVVRNPWSRTVSRYTWALQEGDIAAMSFLDFLELRHVYAGKRYFWHSAVFGWYQQKDFVTSEAGALCCDILRHRHLTDEGSSYFGVPVGHENRSSKLDYRTMYGAKEHDIVQEWYAEDIEFFGFTFDGIATKNTFY